MEITVQDLQAARTANEEFLLLDVRNDDEVATASITGAKHIPMREIPTRFGEIDDWRDRRIIVHCHHGARSARVQAFLLEQGFKRVENLAGGIHQWSLEIDPTVPVYQ